MRTSSYVNWAGLRHLVKRRWFILILTLFTAPCFASELKPSGNLDTFLNQLKSPNPFEKRRGIASLVALGPKAKSAIPEFIRLLKDDDYLVRHDAVLALGSIGYGTESIIPELINAFMDPSISNQAKNALVRFGPSVLQQLMLAAKRPEKEVSSMEIEA